MPCALPFSPISANTVALDEVLGAYDTAFRIAVHRILLEEGFEVGREFPDLQLAKDLRDALGWRLRRQGHEAAWESLLRFLAWADRQGILLDLNPEFRSQPALV